MDKFHSFEQMKALLSNDALRLIELIGYKNAVLLSASFGGFNVTLANKEKYAQAVQLIGAENAEKFRQFVRLNYPRPSDYERELSEGIKQLLNIVGDDNFTLICEKLGGLGLFFSSTGKRSRDYQKLKEVIGENLTEQCFTVFKSNYLYIPNLAKLKKLARKKAIISDYEDLIRKLPSQRAVTAYLCNKYQMSDRAILDVLNTIP